MEFKREPLFEVMDEVGALLDMHYQELTLHKDVIKLEPQWSQYAALEQLGDRKSVV